MSRVSKVMAIENESVRQFNDLTKLSNWAKGTRGMRYESANQIGYFDDLEWGLQDLSGT